MNCRRRLIAAVLVLGLLVAIGPAWGQLEGIIKQFPQIPQLPGTPASGSLGDVKIGQALKEALQVGTANAVSLTGIGRASCRERV